MNWERYEKASEVNLDFQDGVMFNEPCWVTKSNGNTGYIYHCEEGGFGVLIVDKHDNEDGEWSRSLEEAKERVKMIFNLIDEEENE